jgi:F-type H+-transporting ATPase subunit b
MEREIMMKDSREIKEKMIADAKEEAQAQGLKMIEQAKALGVKKTVLKNELKLQVSLSLKIIKVLRDELSNVITKLVEKMLGEAKPNCNIMAVQEQQFVMQSNEIAESE